MRRLRPAGIALGCGLVLGAFGWWLATRADGERPPLSEGAPRDLRPAAAIETGHSCGLGPGTSLVIAGTDRSRLAVDPSSITAGLAPRDQAGIAATPAVDEQLAHTWRLALTTLDVRADGAIWLAARFLSWSATSGGADVSVRGGDLSAPFLIELDRRCSVRRFAWRKDADLLGAKDQQGLVAELSFAAPSDGARRYEADGFDATGRYRARYRAEEGALSGETTHYLEEWLAHSEDERDLPRVRRATLEVVPGGAWFASLVRKRTLELRMLGRPVGTLEAEVVAHTEAPDPKADLVGPLPPPADAGWVWGLLLMRAIERREARVDNQSPELVALSLDDALARLEAMIASRDASPADRVLFMRAWLRAHPELIGELVRRIRQGMLTDRPGLRSALFAALGSANTEATRAALMSLFTDPELGFGLRLDAAQALATAADPLPPGFLDRLIALAEGEAGPAGSLERGAMQLTLGMVAGAQRDARPTEAGRAIATLSGWLDDARTEPASTATVHVLQAAGNAASDELASGLTDWLDDPDPLLRAEAARALRNTSSDLALGPLTALYASEAEARVRVAALGAIEEILQSAGVPPNEAVVRAAMARLGQAQGGEDGALLALLGRAAEAGNTQARQALEQELARELARAERDADRLQAIGRAVRPRWTAGGTPSP